MIFLQNKQRDINGSNKSGKRIATHQLKCQLVSSSTSTYLYFFPARISISLAGTYALVFQLM